MRYRGHIDGPPFRSAVAGGLTAALAIATVLAVPACKGNPDSSVGNPSGVSSAGNMSRGSNAAPGNTASSSSTAAAAFEKPRKPTGTIVIRIITNNSSNFWTAMAKGMDDAKATLADCDAKWQSPPGQSPTHNDQKTTFDNQMAASPDGIAISPIEADAFAPVIDGAIDKGVPVITFDSDAAKSKRLAYIGTNNYEAGKKAGEQAVTLLPKGGKFVAFVGRMSAQNARDRYQGFLDAIKGHNIEPLQDPFQDNADKTGAAYRNVQDAITKYPGKIDLMLGIWSYNGPAIIDKVVQNNLRSKIKIVAFDGDPKTLKALEAGTVDAAVVQKPYEFGRLATMLLYGINRKGYSAALQDLKPELDKQGMTVKDNIIDTGVSVITPGPVATDFIKKLKEKGLETT